MYKNKLMKIKRRSKDKTTAVVYCKISTVHSRYALIPYSAGGGYENGGGGAVFEDLEHLVNTPLPPSKSLWSLSTRKIPQITHLRGQIIVKICSTLTNMRNLTTKLLNELNR